MQYELNAARCALALTTIWLCMTTASAAPPADTDWPSYNNTANGQRFSTLDQITTSNVAQLSEVCRLKADDSGTFQPGMIEIEGVSIGRIKHLFDGWGPLIADADTCVRRSLRLTERI